MPYSLFIRVVMALCLVVVYPTAAAAQQDGSPSPVVLADQKHDDRAAETDSASGGDGDFFSQAHRQRLYREGKKSPTKAALLTLAFPGLGNIYADQYFYAGIMFMMTAFTAVFLGYGFTTNQAEFLWSGAATALIGYGGGTALSIYGVHKFNENMREGLKLDQPSSSDLSAPSPSSPEAGAPAPFRGVNVTFTW